AGPQGLSFLTLRNSYDPAARYMPESRVELPPQRNVRQVIGAPAIPGAAAISTCTALIEQQADGLGAWYYRLPPHETVRGPDRGEGRGQHWAVIAGALQGLEAAPLSPYSCVFVSPDEPALTAQAGSAGLEIVVVQYPRGPGGSSTH